MACISPLRIVDPYGQVSIVPCQKCLPCIITKQQQLEFLAKRELLIRYQKGESASFITLTYDEEHLPKNPETGFQTLDKRDLQLIIKRIRRQIDYYNLGIKFKYIACGEYGGQFSRAHMHIIVFGLNEIQLTQLLYKTWNKGLIDIGPLTQGGIRYVLDYMQKTQHSKEIKELRAKYGQTEPFLTHSIGLGNEWIKSHLQEIYESRYCFNLNGKIVPYPKYVREYVQNYFHDYNAAKNIKLKIENDILDRAKAKDITPYELTQEENYIKYKMKVNALRSKNIPVNDITLSKAYIRPHTQKIKVKEVNRENYQIMYKLVHQALKLQNYS